MAKKPKTHEGDKFVIHTPVLYEGKSVYSHILIEEKLVGRVTDEALAGIEGYDPSETKQDAIEAWIGRFATNELHEHGLKVAGWSANHNSVVLGDDALDPKRILPFLLPGAARIGSFVVTKESITPQTLRVERDFTPRAMAFLLEHGIVAESA